MRRCFLAFALLWILLSSCASPSPELDQPTQVDSTTAVQSSPTSPVISATVQAELATQDATPSPPASPEPSGTPSESTLAPGTVASFPNPDAFAWRQIAKGLNLPIGITYAADRSGRLFIIEQEGTIRIWKDNQLLESPFLDIRDKIDCCGERGLLGLAFHPRFAENGYFYINYTEELDGQLYTVIARYQATSGADQADPNSELRIFHLPQPYQNHNGGGLAFGPDGFLYIALGDGGSGGDPLGNGQSLETLLGKLLRVDVDSAEPYAIPSDNPFANGGGLAPIWIYGLRNPWRFSFDRMTGDLFIGDVGQGQWEEIDFLPASHPGGGNLGWNYYEGSHAFKGSPPEGLELIAPIAEYGHDSGVSVIGGYVYRGQSLPEWQGVYLYGDYASGNIWGLIPQEGGAWLNAMLFETLFTITSFGEDEAGEIYLTDYAGGVYRLEKNE